MGKQNLKEIVYNEILKSIYSSEYNPDKIITESELIQRFGYSKSPIRDALVSLCHEGVLKSIPRYGYEVVLLTTQDILYIQEYRKAIETTFLRLGFSNITSQDIVQLEELDSLCRKENGNLMERWLNNVNFHTALISFAKNPFVCGELRHCMGVLGRAYAQLHWNKWNRFSILNDMKNHALIINCLKNNDIDQAAAYLENDLNDFGT
ncbi:GntR family transcriptional regulator [Lachnospiraceae bacterium 54-53]